MSEERKTVVQQLADIQGYIIYCVDKQISPGGVLFNVSHDINGIIRGEKGFLPRTDGYAKYLKEAVK